MADEVVLRILTGREHLPVVGSGSTVLPVPGKFYIERDGQPVLELTELGTFLRQLAERQAGALRGVLHHAEFVVTTDPEVLRRRGAERDLHYLEDFPDKDLLVGQLYWSDEVRGGP